MNRRFEIYALNVVDLDREQINFYFVGEILGLGGLVSIQFLV
jgi:hypothetical protein